MKHTFLFSLTVSVSFLLAGCQATTTTNGNANSNLVNTNVNVANSNIANANVSTVNTTTAGGVETKEPEKYQAKVALKLETQSDTQKATLPTISAIVARDGANRRMEFTLPNNEKLIYLDTNGKTLLISPDRKQYAELNKDSIGFDVRKLLMPEQIVAQIKNQKGVELVGEEQMNGRTVVKYRYGSTTNTQTQAGQVNTESFLLVDKETGLPLRSETVAASQNGQVQGMKQARVVTEMSDISSSPAADLFAEPTDFKKVAPEEIRAQMNMLVQLGVTILGQMMQQAAVPTATTTPEAAGTPK